MHPFKLRLSTLITAVVALALLVVAIDWSAHPGVAEAAAPPTPSWDSTSPVASGDGTMTLDWNTVSGATGYEYRYSTETAPLLLDTINCADGTLDCVSAWKTASTSGTDTDFTTVKGTLAVGTTYVFQVRAVNTNDDPVSYSDPSTTESATQRATPSKLANFTATAGNAQVTLGWDAPPAGELVINHNYRINSGGSWGEWSNDFVSTNSHVVTGLTNGTTYSFQVRANNNQGNGPDSDTVTATPSGPPAVPDLRATPRDTAVRLFWADLNDASITKFQVRRKEKPSDGDYGDFGTWSDIPSSSKSTKALVVLDLTNGTEYTFEVRAVNDIGNGAAGSATATPVPTTAARTPSVMVNVQHTVTGVSNGAGGTVTFTWDNPNEDFVTKFQYRYDTGSSNPASWDQDWIDAPGGTSNNMDMVTFSRSIPGNSATLFFELRAINGTPSTALNGPATAITVSRTNTSGTSTPPPTAPTNLAAAATSGQVALSWTAPSDTLLKFEYRQSIDGGNSWSPDWGAIPDSAPGSTNAASYTVSELTDGNEYTFEIRAVAGTTDKPVNGAAARAGPVIPGAPNAPTELSAVNLTDDDQTDVKEDETQLVLSWTVPTAIDGVTITGYEYHQRASGGGGFGDWESIEGEGTTTRYTVTELLHSTTYDFQVRAEAVNIASDPSNSASGTTAGPSGG